MDSHNLKEGHTMDSHDLNSSQVIAPSFSMSSALHRSRSFLLCFFSQISIRSMKYSNLAPDLRKSSAAFSSLACVTKKMDLHVHKLHLKIKRLPTDTIFSQLALTMLKIVWSMLLFTSVLAIQYQKNLVSLCLVRYQVHVTFLTT